MHIRIVILLILETLYATSKAGEVLVCSPNHATHFSCAEDNLGSLKESQHLNNIPPLNKEIGEKAPPVLYYTLDHHQELGIETIKGLIQKGYRALKAIQEDTLTEDFHQLDYFGGDLSIYNRRLFSKGLHLGWGIEEILKKVSDEAYQKERSNFHWRRNKQLETFISVIWALTHYAFEVKQGFIRGAFSVIDPERKLYHYLENFSCFSAEVKRADQLPLAVFNILGSNFAYNRSPKMFLSSHYVDLSKQQIGIDIRFGPNQFALGLLPFKMTHILCGLVKTQTGTEKTFVKFEEEGLGDLRSLFSHNEHYRANTEGIDQRLNVRREKAIPASIAKKTESFLIKLMEIKNSEGQLNVEDWVIEQFNAYLSSKKGTVYFENSATIDLSRLYRLSKSYQFSPSHAVSILANDLLKEILANYDERTIWYRTGNEVIIDLEEMTQVTYSPHF